MLKFIRSNATAFSWGALLVALGSLLTGIGTGNGAAIVAALAALIQAGLPAVVNWFLPTKPEPVPPAPLLATPPPAGFRPD